MSIEVRCAACDSTHRVNTRMAGRSVRCPTCDSAVTVPQPTPEAIQVIDLDAEFDSRTEIDFDAKVGTQTGGLNERSVERDGPAVVGRPGGTPTAVIADPSPSGSRSTTGGGDLTDRDPTDTVLFHDTEEEESHRRERREPEELDMTPMVDVTFLLLIFFMVTASFSMQKSIEVPRQTTDLPSAAPIDEETEDLDPVELEIDEFGGFYVITADFEEEAPGKQNLIRTLKRAVGASQEAMQLKIRVHEMARLQSLVDGMDAGTIAGFAEIEVSQVDDL